jgi:hypothetical protein
MVCENLTGHAKNSRRFVRVWRRRRRAGMPPVKVFHMVGTLDTGSGRAARNEPRGPMWLHARRLPGNDPATRARTKRRSQMFCFMARRDEATNRLSGNVYC